MKLFYCHIPSGNFGDELNTYLWPRLLPDAFSGTVLYRPKDGHAIALSEADTTLFVGIGTLIRSELPGRATKHVFGSGCGYGKNPPLDASWNFHCVRGPLTEQALGLDPGTAITDPGVLVRLVARAPSEKTHRFSFIPHWEMALSGDWERVCRLIGINYIDPRWSPPRVIEEIGRTETLITEALHGAIVADALRVPWIAVSSQHTILKFKWEDWTRSVKLTYAPAIVPTFWQPRPGLAGKLINTGKQVQAALQLSFLMRTATPVLSKDAIIGNVTERLVGVLDDFTREHRFTLNLAPQV